MLERHDPARVASGIPIGVVATAAYLPSEWTTAAQLAELTGIDEGVIVERFGLRGKHRAARGEHVTDMAREAARRLFAEQSFDPLEVDALVYFGSTYKDYPVWQVAPRIAHELGCTRAFALELDYVSCGSPVALRMARGLMADDPLVRTVLLVGASCESRLIDYHNERTRFMFNFGDGAVAVLLRRDHESNHVLKTAMRTDGSFSLNVKVPAGGSVEPASHHSVDLGHHTMDVVDEPAMRAGLDAVSLDNFLWVAREAVERSGYSVRDIDYVCPIHMKRSMHRAVLEALGCREDHAVYLEDAGHMSGVDNLLGLDRLDRSGRLGDGDLVLLLAAGTGYTWAATLIRWGSAQ